jgi:hypothetical protein
MSATIRRGTTTSAIWKVHVATVAEDLRAYLDQLLAKAGFARLCVSEQSFVTFGRTVVRGVERQRSSANVQVAFGRSHRPTLVDGTHSLRERSRNASPTQRGRHRLPRKLGHLPAFCRVIGQ